MANITVNAGSNIGTSASDMFTVPIGVRGFEIDGRGGNDRVISDINALIGKSWAARDIEEWQLFGQSEDLFTVRFGSDPKTVDLSAVSSTALVTIDGNNNTIIGGPQTIIDFNRNASDGAVRQSFDMNTGTGSIDTANGSLITVSAQNVPGFGAYNDIDATVTGNAANNFFGALSGDHTFTGGEGRDTVVVLAGAAGVDPDAYSIVKGQSDTLTVSSTAVPNGLSIQGQSVERLDFLDAQNNFIRQIAFDVGVGENAGMAYRLYQAAFARTPDQEGLAFWINAVDQGLSLFDMAGSFVTSNEFITTYGSGLSTDAYVTQLYQNVLGRISDQAGFDFWTSNLEQGSVNRAEVLAYFSESEENILGVAPSISDGITFI